MTSLASWPPTSTMSTMVSSSNQAKDSTYNFYWCKLPHTTGEDHFQLQGRDGDWWYCCSCCKPNIRNSCNDTSLLGGLTPATGKMRFHPMDQQDFIINCTPNALQFIAVINHKMSNIEFAKGELGEWPNMSRFVVDGKLVHKGHPWKHFHSPKEMAQDCKEGNNQVMLGKGELSFIWLGVPTQLKDGSWFIQFPTMDDFLGTPVENLCPSPSTVAIGHKVKNLTKQQYDDMVEFVEVLVNNGLVEFGRHNQWYRDHCAKAQQLRFPDDDELVEAFVILHISLIES